MDNSEEALEEMFKDIKIKKQKLLAVVKNTKKVNYELLIAQIGYEKSLRELEKAEEEYKRAKSDCADLLRKIQMQQKVRKIQAEVEDNAEESE